MFQIVKCQHTLLTQNKPPNAMAMHYYFFLISFLDCKANCQANERIQQNEIIKKNKQTI